MTTFNDLIRLTFGAPEDGQVNFTALYSLFYAILYKLNLNEEKALLDNELIDQIKQSVKNNALIKSVKDNIGENSYVGMVDRVKKLEKFWNNLNNLPNNEYLIKAAEANLPNLRPLSDMWDKLKSGKNIESSQTAIAKLFSLLEDLSKFAAELDNYNKELTSALLGDDSKGMTVKEAIEKLGEQAAEFERMQGELDDIMKRLGGGTMPSDDFFDNLPSWYLIEQLLNGTYENTWTGEEKRKFGEIPLTEELKFMLEELGKMIKYNDELLARVQTLENNLQNLTDRSATKTDIQKLNLKMTEVQGIAGAVDRLLCRIQGSEDQLCCLRQVINKIYGCIGNSAKEGGLAAITACLGGKQSGGKMKEEDTNAGGVNDQQLKIFMDQLNKVECELEAIKRNLTSVDGIKADVQNLFSIVNELDENKLDKCLLATELSQKADKAQVDDKVTMTCFETTCNGLKTVVQDILAKILENNNQSKQLYDTLDKKIQSKANMEDLESLKDQLEAKLKCMANNFVGLQKYSNTDGDSDDKKKNLNTGTGNANQNRNLNQNQNQNDTGTPDSASGNTTPASATNTTTTTTTPATTQPLPEIPQPSLPLNAGFPGNRILKNFPLKVRGTEIKGANKPKICGIKGDKKKKTIGLDDLKPTPEICTELFNQELKLKKPDTDAIPKIPEMKGFVSEWQKSLDGTINFMRSCSDGTKLDENCPIIKPPEQNDPQKPKDKSLYSGLGIGNAAIVANVAKTEESPKTEAPKN